MDIKLRHVNKVRKRLADGSVKYHYYHRKTGKRIEGEFGSPEFLSNYASAAKHYENQSDTFDGIITQYLESGAYKKLADKTRASYRVNIDKIKEKFGDIPTHVLNDKRVRRDFFEWRDSMASTPRQADLAWSVLRRVLAWAYDQAFIEVNHAQKPGRLYSANRNDIIWTVEKVSEFMKVAPLELQRALVLALYTGQRQGDLLRLTWANYDGVFISLRQGKTGMRVEVPVHKELKGILDKMKEEDSDLVILKSKSGASWKADHFRHEWRKYTLKAGLDGLRFHDLRGTAVTLLHEAGCTNKEVATFTGHSMKTVDEILEVYSARTRKIALTAIRKLENETPTILQTKLQTVANRTFEKNGKS